MKNEQTLKNEYQRYHTDIDDAIKRVLRSGRYILGPELERFEKRFAEYTGATYCVGVGSGFDGLYLAYLIANARGKKVFIKNELHPATTNSALLNGAEITDDWKEADIVTVVHKDDSLVNCKQYRDSEDYKIIIEDCCQALGCTVEDKHVGNFGMCGVFSFHPLKKLHCYGDGGAVITNNKYVYDLLVKYRNHGRVGKDYSIGINSRLDEIQAGILNVFMDNLKEIMG